MNRNSSYELTKNYIGSLINQFFKILPIKESGEASLSVYMKSLQREILGSDKVLKELGYDPGIISLVSILESMMCDGVTVAETKADVFKAISICKKMISKLDTLYDKGGAIDESMG